MTYNEFLAEFKRIFILNDESLLPPEDKIKKFYELTEIMLEVNKHMNLTAVTDCSQIILKHYYDCLTILKYLPPNASVIDVGCGAGFPSLPVAICREDVEVTAVDSTAKRINYISDTAKKLGIKNITAISARAEDLATKSEYREKYDLATARAVADLPALCELCIPFVKVGGTFLAMKGAKGEAEFEKSCRAISLCGGSESKVVGDELTQNGAEFEKRCLIIVKKGEKTPKIYPRNFAQISKKPL